MVTDTITLPKGRYIEGSLPMYADISLVTAERHHVAALSEAEDYAFAAAQPTVPLTVDEFERAALEFPIVFVGPARRAFAVLSLQAEHNSFVEADGGYRPGAYVPAYLRRYPFVLVRDPEQDQWVLGVDEFSPRLVPLDEPGARPLFEDGAPAIATREAVAFCEAYANAERRTEAFVQLLDELELFESRQAHHQRPDQTGEPVLLLDFVAVSRTRLDALDSAAIERLRAIGGLAPIYAHLLSEANWERLAITSA